MRTDTIRRIQTEVIGLDELRLGAGPLRLDAVVRNLEVIGEAVKRLPEQLIQRYSHVEWRTIAGLREIRAILENLDDS